MTYVSLGACLRQSRALDVVDGPLDQYAFLPRVLQPRVVVN